MVGKEVILSKEGYKELEERLNYLKDEKRHEVALKIKAAREFGDLSENAEYAYSSFFSSCFGIEKYLSKISFSFFPTCSIPVSYTHLSSSSFGKYNKISSFSYTIISLFTLFPFTFISFFFSNLQNIA